MGTAFAQTLRTRSRTPRPAIDLTTMDPFQEEPIRFFQPDAEDVRERIPEFCPQEVKDSFVGRIDVLRNLLFDEIKEQINLLAEIKLELELI